MADFSLNDYFSGVRMTQLFQSEAVKRGVTDPLAGLGLDTPSPNSPVGVQVQWDEITGNRQLAQLVNFGAASRTVDMQGIQRRYATAIGAKEDFVVSQQLLLQLKNNIPLMSEAAKRELVNKASNFRTRFDNLSKASRASVFANGAIYVDGSGNVLPTSSGSSQASVNFSIPTGNKLTKAGAGSTYNIGDWSAPSTDIAGILRTYRKFLIKKNGYLPTTMLYGTNIPGYILANTTLQTYWARNPMQNQNFLDTNEIPDGFLGYKWKPVYTAFFDDSTSTTQQWFADNFIGIMPDVSPDWYEYFECGSLVPTSIGTPGMSLDAMIDSVTVAYGLFSYGEMTVNPMALRSIYGWYGLPTIKVPGAYAFGTCS